MADMTLALAPERLWQSINPWRFYMQGAQFGTVTFNIGETRHPEVEAKLLEEVGSYGRQIGRIGDALEVLVNRLDRTGLTQQESDALTILLGQLAEVRKVKKAALANA